MADGEHIVRYSDGRITTGAFCRNRVLIAGIADEAAFLYTA